VTSLCPKLHGAIDSLFVLPGHRSHGIGAELMRRALEWLDASGATSKMVSVFHANGDALNFYARFGFHPRAIELQQI
jgi:GNAT superfamily N-acetyltransferase